MSGFRVPVLLTVLSGSFESQPHAFSVLKDEADGLGLAFDMVDVDVIREAPEVRLAHYFRPQIVARIQNLQKDENTAIVLRPSSLTVDPRFPPEMSSLRLLGKFAGSLIEPPELTL